MSYEEFLKDLGRLFFQFKEALIAFIPKLVFAIVIILIGILIARLFQALVNRFIKNLDRFISSKKLQSGFKQIRLERSARLVGKIVYWIILIFFLTAATCPIS